MKITQLLLWPLSLAYGLGLALRNFLFDRNILRGVRFNVPVISVGNLSVGGTGKTPHVEYLIRLLQPHYSVATMSRGYKRETRGFLLADADTGARDIGDEPAQLFQKFPGITVSVCEQRMTGIPRLMGLLPDTEVVLLDDAYQHRSVRPGLQILLTSYARPFYRDHLLPMGTLREPRKGYKRADIIVVSKCPSGLSESDKKNILRAIRPLPRQAVFFSGIRYGSCYDLVDKKDFHLPPGAAILLVCGIADPTPLVDHLRPRAAHLEVLRYPDHYAYGEKDIERILQRFEALPGNAGVVLSTEKDAMRLEGFSGLFRSRQVPVGIVPMEVRFDGEEAFNDLVLKYIESEKAR